MLEVSGGWMLFNTLTWKGKKHSFKRIYSYAHGHVRQGGMGRQIEHWQTQVEYNIDEYK